MPAKRPFGANANGYENGDSKRARSNNGSPAPPAHAIEESDIDRKKREAAERIAALRARISGNGNTPTSRSVPTAAAAAPASIAPATSAQDAAAVAARITAMRARLSGAATSPSPTPAPTSPSPAPPASTPQLDKQAELKAKIERLKAQAAQKSQNRPSTPSQFLAPTPPVREDNSLKARGGLNVGLHPSLLGNAAKPDAHDGRGKQRADQNRDEVGNRENKYLAHDTVQESHKSDPNYDPSFQKQKDRTSRQLLFNQKGKFIAQANALRQQERLEAMKREMQEQARKAAIEQATEKSFLVPAPPDLEWWDEGLINGSTYDNVDDPSALNFDVITAYVQHPVLLAAPQEANAAPLKPMYLTKTEQKKVRRQRRMADHKEEQAKIRLGLKAPPPPKVKKSNLMRVLGEEAVKDPTAVEARVNREIAQRAADHDAANDDRMLTREQRAEKLASQQEADAAKGIRILVFRIDNLSYGKHRFQISKNAEQNNLTGITIFHPRMNLVIAEGGPHSIANYRKLMLQRVKWTENAAPQSVREGNNNNKDAADAEWLRSVDDRGVLKDLTRNRCTLVFEGEEKKRSFKYWNAYKLCETDGEAKDALSRYKMENMWTLAQSVPTEES